MNCRPALIWLTFAAIAGCGRDASPPAPIAAPASTATTTGVEEYTLRGVVREVDAPSGVVTIAHEEIPGFMKAMTMDFTPEDRANLGELGVGDTVEGPLVVRSEGGTVADYNLKRLAVTKVAPKSLTLDFAAGAATFAPKPAVLAPGEPVPDFALTTQDGTPLKLSDLRGKVVVLTFIYTRCPLPDYCPAVDKKFRELAERVGAVKARADAVRLLSISFDPEHDTPEALRKHAGLQGAKPPLWTYAVASHDELRKVAGRFGLIYGPMSNEIRHNLCTAVVAPDGTLARLDAGTQGKAWTPADLMATIAPLVR